MARKHAMKWNDLNLNQRSSRLQMTMWSLIEEMNRDSSDSSDNQINQKNPYSKKQAEMNRDSSDSSDNQLNQKNRIRKKCSITRKYSYQRSEFLRFNLYLRHAILEFCLFSFSNTKISENSDMAKSWAFGSAAWLVQKLFVAQVLKKFNL